jgi:hypothetical protein
MANRFTRRIMKEISILKKNSLDNKERDDKTPLKYYFYPNESDINIAEIDILTENFYDPDLSEDKQQLIYTELKKNCISSIRFEIRFNDYPIKPPFIRVMKPVLTGGNVMSDGNICIDLFGSKLWVPSISIENVMVMVFQLLKDNKYLKLGSKSKQYTYEGALNNDKSVKRIHSNWNYKEDLM